MILEELEQSKSKKQAIKDITEDGANYVVREAEVINACKYVQTILSIDTSKL
jgi:hypothetical protein